MKCEKCNKDHNGEYGSGRFCTPSCARSFSTKEKRKEINNKVSLSLKGRCTSGGQKNWTEKSYNKQKKTWNDKLLSTQFESLSYERKRKRIILEQDGKCRKCELSKWMDKNIPIEIDHINGINGDDRRENMVGLCPNCHSITDTWRGRNKKRKKVSDETLINALSENTNIRQALISLGMAPKGSNYERAKRLLNI